MWYSIKFIKKFLSRSTSFFSRIAVLLSSRDVAFCLNRSKERARLTVNNDMLNLLSLSAHTQPFRNWNGNIWRGWLFGLGFLPFFSGRIFKSKVFNIRKIWKRNWKDVFQTVCQCTLGKKCASKHLQVSLQVKISSVSIILLKLSKITKLPMDVAWKISRLFDVSRSQKKLRFFAQKPAIKRDLIWWCVSTVKFFHDFLTVWLWFVFKFMCFGKIQKMRWKKLTLSSKIRGNFLNKDKKLREAWILNLI